MNSNEIVREVRRLLGVRTESINRLNADINDSTDTVVTTYDLNGLTAGSYFEINRELLHIWDANTSTKTLTVERGHLGSDAASHTAGDIITVSPDYPTNDILKAVEDELRLLPQNGVYRQKTATIDFDTVDYDYPISLTDILHPYLLEYKLSGYDHYDYEFSYVGPDSIIRPHYPYTYPDDLEATLHYKATFGDLPSDLTEDITEDTGLPESAHEILVYGAASRLLMTKEIQRIDINANPVAGIEEVPPQATMRGVDFIRAQYQSLIQNEVRRLQSNWPWRIK